MRSWDANGVVEGCKEAFAIIASCLAEAVCYEGGVVEGRTAGGALIS